MKALFESAALAGRGMSTREIAQNFNVTEVHANDRIRVNRTIQNVSEFYETYGIKEGDLMFVPASERVKIW